MHTEKLHATTEIQFKSFSKKEEETGVYGYFKGYGSVFNVTDSYGDVITQGAFTRTLMENKGKMPLLWQHDMYDVIGSVTSAEEDNYGLKVEGRINLNTTRGKDAYALIKAGDMNGLSIGFWINSCTEKPEENKRYITDITLAELSIVTMPANGKAQISEVKSLDLINNATTLAEIETILRKHRFSKNEATAIVAKVKKFDQKRSESAEQHRSESEINAVAEAFAEALAKFNSEIKGN